MGYRRAGPMGSMSVAILIALTACGALSVPSTGTFVALRAPIVSGAPRKAGERQPFIYVVNAVYGYGNATITEYERGADGTRKPVRAIGGSNTMLDNPGGIGLDSRGKIYVADLFSGSSRSGSYSGNVVAFASQANGNEAPMDVITDGMIAPAAVGDEEPVHEIAGSNTGLYGSAGTRCAD